MMVRCAFSNCPVLGPLGISYSLGALLALGQEPVVLGVLGVREAAGAVAGLQLLERLLRRFSVCSLSRWLVGVKSPSNTHAARVLGLFLEVVGGLRGLGPLGMLRVALAVLLEPDGHFLAAHLLDELVVDLFRQALLRLGRQIVGKLDALHFEDVLVVLVDVLRNELVYLVV